MINENFPQTRQEWDEMLNEVLKKWYCPKELGLKEKVKLAMEIEVDDEWVKEWSSNPGRAEWQDKWDALFVYLDSIDITKNIDNY